MARITLFWCFEKKISLNRIMKFQVKFCQHSGLRPWRTGMLFSTKSKGHKSKFRISWMCRYCFYDLKVLFWWPNKHLFWCKSSLNTLYTLEKESQSAMSIWARNRVEIMPIKKQLFLIICCFMLEQGRGWSIPKAYSLPKDTR